MNDASRRKDSTARVARMLTAAAVVAAGAVGLAFAQWSAVVPAVAAVLALAAPGGRCLRYRRTGAAASAVAAVSLLCTLLHRGPLTGSAGIWVLVELAAFAVLVGVAVRHAPGRQAAGAAALAVLALGLQPLRMLRDASPLWTEYVFFLGGWTIVGLVAVAVGVVARLADRRRSRALAEVRRRERLALAGDLHDLVAHDVTGIVLDAQATRAEADPAQAPDALERIEKAGLQALAAMDRTVGMLRDEGGAAEPGTRTYGVADVAELADRFAATARVPVHRHIDPDLADRVPREAGDAVYRLVAEALTNVRRHAPSAAEVSVALTAEAAVLRVRVADTASRSLVRHHRLAHRGGHGGTGLIGLAARVEALGGELHAGPDATGWLVEASLPLGREAS
ncbi:sensor histidine kinase [Glycomyces tritici]|uniref:histidine kinase n=1 Tax=Glycomyces tritici TaxID=2665176 RepID=A0ABT7YWS5_9ACTN|nr:histidine kinase [Glycomyces tritici]MDN3243074.1 histidine kinase [Glycomyces tritici]